LNKESKPIWRKFQLKKSLLKIFILLVLVSCSSGERQSNEVVEKIKANPLLTAVKERAVAIVKTGFTAGDGYSEVWIRDFNTFINLALVVHDKATIKEHLNTFFRFQGDDGNIIDGFVPKKNAIHGYDYIYTKLEPRYAGHKNTVETDQESSMIHAIYKYIQKTGDTAYLAEKVEGQTVADRMEMSMQFLMDHRFNEKYGLIWGATTADWSDIQPEHKWGVFLTEDSHYAIDIYDNAMFTIALNNMIAILPGTKTKWAPILETVKKNCRKHLWDESNQKFIPNIYLKDSPFPDDFNENEIFYHGGTAVAIEAGLLSKDEIQTSLNKMITNIKACGAATIGLTLYPTYPKGFFKNRSMDPYVYQNGGDWTWFGGRMIQQLIRFGFVEQAIEQLLPMLERVEKNKGFFEWYTIKNEPKGSGTFRGSAGVLYDSIVMLESGD